MLNAALVGAIAAGASAATSFNQIFSIAADHDTETNPWDNDITVSGDEDVILLDFLAYIGSGTTSNILDPGGANSALSLHPPVPVLSSHRVEFWTLPNDDMPSGGTYTLRASLAAAEIGFRQIVLLEGARQTISYGQVSSDLNPGTIAVGAVRSGGGNFPAGSRVFAACFDGDGSQSYTVTGDAILVRDIAGGAAGERFVFASGVLASDAASASVTFTPAATVNRMCAVIAVVEPSDGVPPTPPSGLEEDQPLPEANNVLPATPATFDSVYASAVPGDHIVLANGSYGAKTLSRNFTAGPYALSGTPVVIRTANATGRPNAVPTSGNSALFSHLSLSGDGHIVSGVAVQGAGITGGVGVSMTGSNNRLTRSIVRNVLFLIAMGNGTNSSDPASDIMLDHCTLNLFGENSLIFNRAIALRRPIIARCWITDGVGEPAPGGILNSGMSLNNQNIYREQPVSAIVRLCYFGPNLDDCTEQAWLHNKCSDNVVARNRFDKTGVANDLVNHRLGLRARYIANYMPLFRVWWCDDSCWCYGNQFDTLRVFAGRSAYYDQNANDVFGVTGFHTTTRTRIAGNSGEIFLGENSPSWVTNNDPSHGLPDPMAAGVAKPARSLAGVNYAAFPAGEGIAIRAHTGAITQAPNHSSGFDWVVNLDSQPATTAPTAWLSELFDQHPWIQDLAPDPTSLTGGPQASAPSSIAQALTRGDAADSNVGPFRNSPGGLP